MAMQYGTLEDEYKRGITTLLEQCLNVRKGENILVLYTPPSMYKSTLEDYGGSKGVNLFWTSLSDLYEEDEKEEQIEILRQEREDILMSLQRVALELGCRLFLFPIEIVEVRENDHFSLDKRIVSDLKEIVKKSTVILDFTLLGIDNYLRLKKTATKHLKEIVTGVRGVDIHNLDAESLLEGAMLENYERMAERIEEKFEIIKKATSVAITAPGTNITLPIDKKGDKIKATGIIKKKEWHFLPNGIISLCVDHTKVTGSITLSGPMWGVDNLNHQPITLQTHNGGVLKFASKVRNEQIERLLDTEEGRYIGEVVFGFNTKAIRESDSPYEFYTASGNVTIALGRNDHLNGSNKRKENKQELAPIIHTHALVKDATVTLNIEGEEKKIINSGNWVGGKNEAE